MFARRVNTRRVNTRRTEARQLREEAAEVAFLRPHPDHVSNSEESDYRRPSGDLSYIANYSKGLRHNGLGEVNVSNYRALLRAIYSGNPDHFEQIPLGTVGGRKLTNPQAGLAFDLEGPDAQAVTQPPAPRIDSAENSGEMGELYWMALLRDVNFDTYPADPGVAAAAVSLSGPGAGGQFTDFRGPKDSAGNVTPDTLFRGSTPGDLVGPYVSQFLLQPIPYGTLFIEQLQRTAPAGSDNLTNFFTWRAVQNGFPVTPGPLPPPPPTTFIRNLRDLATYVHFDALYEAYLNACLILLDMQAPFDPGNPYVTATRQEGFATFGGPHILSLVTEVATRALKAVWFQKWGVHRRLRPEEFGGRIHVHLLQSPGRYPMIDPEILDTTAGSVLDRIRAHNLANFGDDTYLLPQAFTEGCPTHPAYGAGHATVGGVCVTILKAWFDESFIIPNPVVPDPVATNNLIPAPAGTPPLTVGGELNKLAANIALARNAAGVHWRSDYTESIQLGEEIAIRILQEQKMTYNEDHHLSLTKFDGTRIVI
jgi:hypothetical protein